MGMDCHLFAYLADESPLLHMSISIAVYPLLYMNLIYRYFHLCSEEISIQIGYLIMISYQFESFEPFHIWILSVH